MARPRFLDQKLLDKVRQKLGKSKGSSINVIVSQKASSLGVSSEAALVLISKELGIGTATYQRKLDPQKQSEIRDMLPVIFSRKNATTKNNNNFHICEKDNIKSLPAISKRARLRAAVEYLLEDTELKERCIDLLLASTNFDRPINQATLVLENRIRIKASPQIRLEGVNLVNRMFSGNLSKTILKVSNNPDEQDGFTNILRGVMLAFRNPTHHHVINTFSREQALKVCGLVDVLLKVVDGAEKIG